MTAPADPHPSPPMPGILRLVGLVLLYAGIRAVWHWVSYAFIPDAAIQMQVALNLLDGKGVTFCMDPGGGPVCTDYFNHPPGGSFWMLLFQPLTGNIILADLAGRCAASLLEGALLLGILRRLGMGGLGLSALMAVAAIYVGHLDRGGSTDMLAGILSTGLMWLAYDRLRSPGALGPASLSLACTAILALPLVKYNAVTASLTPLAVFLAAGILGRRRVLPRRQMALLAMSTAGAFALFIWLVKVRVVSHPVLAAQGYSSGQVKSTFAYYPEAWADLWRVDYFWLHFGMQVDRYVKYATLLLHPGSPGPMYLHHVTQAVSLGCLALMVWRIRRRTALQADLLFTIGAFALTQAALLALMTLTHEPEVAGYGIDGRKWVYMEEARYYGYISFAVMLSLLVAAWRYLRPLFWGLALLVGLNTAKSFQARAPTVPRLIDTLGRLERGEPLPPSRDPRAGREAHFLRTLLLGRPDAQP